MSNVEALYDTIVSGEPEAVEFYQNLKRRVVAGERAKALLGAIRGVHERRKALAMRSPYVGAAYPPGSYLTPSGKVLTPDVLSQIVDALRSYAGTPMLSAAPDDAAAPSDGGSSTNPLLAPLANARKPTVQNMVSQAVRAPVQYKALGPIRTTAPTSTAPKSSAELKAQYDNAVRTGRPQAILNALKRQWELAVQAGR